MLSDQIWASLGLTLLMSAVAIHYYYKGKVDGACTILDVVKDVEPRVLDKIIKAADARLNG
jgi:hypothetical protein